ncbi:MAG: hypothetical protein ACYCUG_03660 [Acidimicrobiales bacterium]
MSTSDPFNAAGDQVLEILSTAQALFLDAATQWADATRNLTGAIPRLPSTRELPDAAALTEQTFGLAERLLENQREFTLKLIRAYAPAKPANKPATKAAAAA